MPLITKSMEQPEDQGSHTRQHMISLNLNFFTQKEELNLVFLCGYLDILLTLIP